MSVTIDAAMTGGNGGACQYILGNLTSATSTGMTVGASASCLLVLFSLGANSVAVSSPACTWNGVSMNLAMFINNAASPQLSAGIFVLLNPTSGNHTIAMSWTGASDGYISAISLIGTDLVTGYKSADNVTGTATTGITPNIAVNTDVNGATLVIVGDTSGGNAPAPNNQTQLFTNDDSSPNAGASYALGGTGTNTHGFNVLTGAVCVVWAGIHIIAPASGPALTPGNLYLESDEYF
jgi:hypothetical protein